MEASRIQELVAKYNEGLADPAEIRTIEQLIESGELELTKLTSLAALDEQIVKMEDPQPGMQLDARFHEMLTAEKKKQKGFSIQLPSLQFLLPRLAFGILLLTVGFYGGYGWRNAEHPEVIALTSQVTELKEMMMLTMLEKESASERLKAVSLTSDMNQVSDKVTSALFKTMNEDANINVRLAALEALKPYVRQSNVREELIRSISRQDSPLVQVALAELMVSIQEKKSVNELKKVLENQRTPKEVKSKIEESIKTLI